MVLAREQRFAFQHLRKDTSRAPNVHFHVVFLPCEHDLWRTIISCRDIACHLRVLDPGKAEVTNFEIAILVDENVAGLQVAVHNAGGVYVLQTSLQVMSVTVAGGADFMESSIRGSGRGSTV